MGAGGRGEGVPGHSRTQAGGKTHILWGKTREVKFEKSSLVDERHLYRTLQVTASTPTAIVRRSELFITREWRKSPGLYFWITCGNEDERERYELK